jgi:hypothetical protein
MSKLKYWIKIIRFGLYFVLDCIYYIGIEDYGFREKMLKEDIYI